MGILAQLYNEVSRKCSHFYIGQYFGCILIYAQILVAKHGDSGNLINTKKLLMIDAYFDTV